MKILYFLLVLTLSAFNCYAQNHHGQQAKHLSTYKFINGLWFNGKSFEKRDVFVKDNTFSNVLSKVDTIVDLKGQYIVPPFSEAHTHSIEGVGNYEQRIKSLLLQGVFYVKNPNSIKPFTDKLCDKINNTHTIDAIFAHGGLTSTGGHPGPLYEDKVRQHLGGAAGELPRGWFQNKSYFNIDSEKDFIEQWTVIKEGKPDFIKVYLANSEDIGKTPPASRYTFRKGLDPALVSKIVARAHQDGYRVSAHVETRIDFLNALNAGVDEITHTPGFYLFSKDQLDRYRLKKEDALLAAQKNVFVVTAIFSRNLTEDPELMPLVEQMLAYNISLLHQNGVKVAIGSDHADTPVDEIKVLKSFNIFDNLTLLKLWCETSPLAIFPERKLGLLKEGYEASFLALNGDPIADFSNIEKISIRFKQGNFIHDNELKSTEATRSHGH